MDENSVAIVPGAPSARGFEFPRQTNNFYYLCGVETPHSYLWFDARDRSVTLFLPPRKGRLGKSEGKVMSAADADLAKRLIGVDRVLATTEMAGDWLQSALGDTLPAIFVQHRPAEGYAESRYEIQVADRNIANDFWDSRLPRELQLIGLLQARLARAYKGAMPDIRDLSPLLDELRTIKSQREIALLRRASEIAGQGMIEAIRSTEPGVFEYQLDAAARYVFLTSGARLDGYRSITASGTENIANPHYFRNTRRLQSGDLVLMDYAPDYRYYVSDIGRMWPVNGTFSATQRELLEPILRYRNELIARIKPGVTTDEILADAKAAMDRWFEGFEFSEERYERAARHMVDNGSGAFSHPVGLSVHDVGTYRGQPLVAGQVFSVDPTLRVPEENLYLRYEDTVVVTESGVENFTDFLPSELDDIEALMLQDGILQKVPPIAYSD
jgi:Xaa-Pro aminopeptidase